MADFHLSIGTVSRSAGRTATAAAAYRAAAKIIDHRTGEIHDYTRKQGVMSSTILLPSGAPAWAADREALWNAAEQAETRINSVVAREFEIGLPCELSASQREALAHEFTRELVERHQFAGEVSIHEPSRGGDQRNYHAHILVTTRRLGPDGFTEKTRELDDRYGAGKQLTLDWRERWAVLQNRALEAAGSTARVDHRSHAARGIEAQPSTHLGPTATGIERRTGSPSRRRLDREQQAREVEAARQALVELQCQQVETDQEIATASAELAEAQRYRAMSPDELRDAIRDVTPQEIDVQVERAREVLEIGRRVAALRQQDQAAAEAIEAWQEQPPFGVWLRPGKRREMREMQAQHDTIRASLATAMTDAQRIRQEAELRLWPQYQRARSLVAELAELREELRTAATRDRAREQAEAFSAIALQRAHRVIGWEDGGRQWQAAPRALQRRVEAFLAVPEGDRPALLDEIGSDRAIRDLLEQQRRALDDAHQRRPSGPSL